MAVLMIILELTVAFFSVIGVYSLWQLCMGRMFGSDRVVLALEILTDEDASGAEMLIRDAMTQILWLHSGRIVVLTTENIAKREVFSAILKKYGLECRLLSEGRDEE